MTRNMAESPAFSDVEGARSDGEESESEDLPAFEIESVETAEVQPTVLFPQRRTSLEKITKTRKAYSEMIETALYQLNEARSGSSRQAIVKYIRANYEVGDSANRYVSLAIAKLIERERVLRKSGVGMSGKFSLSKEIREAMRKGVNVKPKAKPKPKVPAKSTKTTAKGEGEKAKPSGKSKKAKVDEKGGEESDKENIPKAKKTASKNGAKAAGGRTKKGEGESKTTNRKPKANEEGEAKGKAREKTTKDSKTTSKAKPKAKEAKESQSKTKGKATAKEKGNEKETGGAQSKKSGQAKNTKKNEDKPAKQKAKN